jgi:hypothetical protein
MTVLHLGVVDQPYRHEGRRRAGRRRGRNVKAARVRSMSTFDVASILESKYHVMQHFFDLHHTEVVEAMINSYEGATETALLGGPLVNPSGDGIDDIRKMFNRFLDEEEMNRLGVPGVPTMAALHGVSHRFAHPYAKRGSRPSFVDTGLYESSFRAWVD